MSHSASSHLRNSCNTSVAQETSIMTQTSTLLFLIFTFIISSLWAYTPIQVFPGSHFIPIKPLAIYESSIPISYVISLNLSTLDSIQPPPFPNCLDPSNHDICEMNTGLQDIESTLQDFVDSYSLRNSTTSLRKKRALDSIGNFLNWCCSTAMGSYMNLQAMKRRSTTT